MSFQKLIKILVIFSLFADVTYAAGGSLWGEIDEPAHDVSVSPLVGPTAPPPPDKTVCNVLAQKADLGNDVLNSAKMQGDLKNMMSAVKPEYVMILADTAATKDLYRQFRELYLAMYCSKK